MRSAPSIAFDYRPSRWIAGVAGAISCAAIVAPWSSSLPTSARAVLSLAALFIGVATLGNFVRAGFTRLSFRGAGWKLVRTDGIEVAVDLVSHARLGAWLALDFRDARRHRFHAVLGPGNTDVQTRRRLILLLSRAEVAQTG